MSESIWDETDWSSDGNAESKTIVRVDEDEEEEEEEDKECESDGLESETPTYRVSEEGSSLSCNLAGNSCIPTDLYVHLQSGVITKLILDYNNLSNLPDELFDHITSLKTLSISGNRLFSLPYNIDRLVHLEVLNLDENRLKYLPDEICNLDKLNKLSIQGNELQSLPHNFGQLKSMQILNLNENDLISLPDSFCLLANLQHLDLSYNQIESLPVNFGSLASLMVLNMSQNKLKSLPLSFEHLSQLECLEISSNSLQYLSSHFASAKCLKKLLIDNNELFALPDWVGEMEHIEEISLQRNFLRGEQFTESFGHTCQMLTRLDASGNLLEHLPKSFALLKNLKYLDLGSPDFEPERRRNMRKGNNLYDIPSEFGLHFACLTELRLDENAISVIPESFGDGMPLLQLLDLYHNNITHLPDSFCKLTNLKVFSVGMNALKCFPDEFGNLILLEELRVESNQLVNLPPSFAKLVNLRVLDLYQNKFEVFPSALKKLPKIKYLEVGLNISDMVLKVNPSDRVAIKRLTHAINCNRLSTDRRNGWNTTLTHNYEQENGGSTGSNGRVIPESSSSDTNGHFLDNAMNGTHDDKQECAEETWDVDDFNPIKPYARETLIYPEYIYKIRSPLKRSAFFKPLKLHPPRLKIFRFHFDTEEGQFENDHHDGNESY